MKIFLTGGSGFLGSNISNYLSNKGHQVISFDNSYRNSNQEINSNVQLINGDIRDEKNLIEKSKNVDVFLHLAFINGTRFFYEKPDLVLDVGIRGILNSLEAVKKNNIKKFILASSSEVYNEPLKIPTSEEEPLKIPDIHNPRFSYSGGKLISEILTINSLNNTDITKIIFRPHNIFGENMGEEHVIPEILKKIFISSDKFQKKECKINIQGNGLQTRAFCYVDDAVEQIYYLIQEGINNNVYNVGVNKEITILDLIKNISNILKIKIDVSHSKLKIGSTSRRCPDTNKIETLGYQYNNNILDGLNKTVNWYKDYYLKFI